MIKNSKNMKKRKDLTFQKKFELSEKLKLEKNTSQRQLAIKYDISLGSVHNLLNMKQEKPENNRNLSRKRMYCLRKTKDIDPILYEWFQKQRTRNITVSGDILKIKAQEIAGKLNVSDFKASTGWLHSFIRRNNISSHKICGESGTVSTQIIMSLRDEYSAKLGCYTKENIFNCDETSLFYKQAGNRTYICSNEDKASGKFSKDRVSILLATSSEGEKLQPLVIGKAKKPHCFKGLNISNLPVRYRNNAKSWMTRNIFTDWLKELNEMMKAKSRNILLLLDNASVHTKDLELSHVELFFLPPNTTSLVQPLDQGIIKVFKDEYKKSLNTSINFELNTNILSCQEDILKKITIYQAIIWVSQAWKNTKEECIKNCFIKSFQNAMVINDPILSNQFEIEVNEEFPAYAINDEDEIDNIIAEHKNEQSTHSESNEDSHLDLEKEMSSCEALQAIRKLERYFINNIPDKIGDIWNIEKSVMSAIKLRSPKITDFFSRTTSPRN